MNPILSSEDSHSVIRFITKIVFLSSYIIFYSIYLPVIDILPEIPLSPYAMAKLEARKPKRVRHGKQS
jgi:hypothetical protein